VTRTREVKKEGNEGGWLAAEENAATPSPHRQACVQGVEVGGSSINGSATSIPTGPPEMLAVHGQ
jgi:hypothetical protein